MLRHYKSKHPEETNAQILSTTSDVTENWLETFFAAQKSGIMNVKFGAPGKRHDLCVVCDAYFKNSDVSPSSSYHKSSQDALGRCMRHLHYFPHHCILCKNKGIDFKLSVISTNAYNHVVNKHPEPIDSLLTTIFARTGTVKVLDRFLTDYFKSYGKTTSFAMKVHIPIVYQDKVKAKEEAKIEQINANKSIANLNASTSQPVSQTLLNPCLQPALKILPNPFPSNNTSFQPHQSQPEMMQLQWQSPSTSGARQFRLIPQPGQTISPAFLNAIKQGVSTAPIQMKSMFTSLVQPARINVDLEPSVFDEELSEAAKRVLPDFNYFCVFCKENTTFTSAIDATKHYGEHLNYNPITCLLCSRKFADIETIKEHHDDIHIRGALHPSSSLLFIINEDANIEKWVSDFLLMQKDHKIMAQMNINCLSSCIVCDKLFRNKAKPRTSRNELSEEHIYKHLNYLVFECILCDSKGSKYSYIGENAICHLKTNHGLDLDQETAQTVFKKTHTIHELEQLVHSHIILWKFANGKLKRKVVENQAARTESIISTPAKVAKQENTIDSSEAAVKQEDDDDICVLSEKPASTSKVVYTLILTYLTCY